MAEKKKEATKPKSRGGKRPPPKKTKAVAKKAVKKTAKKTCKKTTKDDKKDKNLPSVVNWKVLKTHYMNHPQISVEAFLREMGILQMGKRPTKTMGKNYKGWREEKFVYLEQKHEEEAEALSAQYAIESSKIHSSCLQKKTRILNAIDKRITRSDQLNNFGNYLISTKELVQMMNVVKTELGEPTSISKSNVNNTNLNINDLIDQMTEEDNRNLDDKENDKRAFGEDVFDRLPIIEIDGREV